MEGRKFFIVALTGLFSCSSTKTKLQMQSQGCLAFFTPATMKMVNDTGIDTHAIFLINDKNDTFYLEYGDPKMIYKVYDPVPPIWDTSRKEHFLRESGKLPDPSDLLFSDNPEVDKSENIFDKNYYMYDTIHNIVVKITLPKRTGNGKTGIYIPKLKDGHGFSMYANNLDSSSQKEAIQIFKSIQYNKYYK